ncbi:MAG: carbohydrate kinase family protein [Chthoniobacterales bacterium]|jgi:sugar/nucleoside kinase (ribokinase family)
MTPSEGEGIGFFGSIIVDRVLALNAWPREGTLGLIETRETLGTGGSAWNDPVNIRAIDPSVPLRVCGVVGDDPMGEFALAHLRERGIDTNGVEVAAGADTSYSIVSNSRATGLRTHLHAKGACALFDLRHVEAFPGRVSIAHLGYLMLLDALEQGEGDNLRARAALAILREKADKVAVDIVSLDGAPARFGAIVGPCLPLIDYLVINEFEAGAITGTEIRRADGGFDGDACREAARRLLGGGVRDTVIIHFPEGAYGAGPRGTEFCPSFEVPRREIDCVVGAGDAFASAVLYGFYTGRSLRDCLRLGNANARHNITSSSCTDGVVALSVLEETIRGESLRPPVMESGGCSR